MIYTLIDSLNIKFYGTKLLDILIFFFFFFLYSWGFYFFKALLLCIFYLVELYMYDIIKHLSPLVVPSGSSFNCYNPIVCLRINYF